MSEAAHTKSDPTFPGYVNLKHQDGAFVLTVRGDPTIKKGVHVCGVTCFPGGPACNNYCGIRSTQPTADKPNENTYVDAGMTAELRLAPHEMINWMLQAGVLINEIV